MKTQLVIAVLAICFSTSGFSADRFQRGYNQSFLVAQQQQQKPISKEQAVRIAKDRVDGKVLSANLRSNGANSHYRVKILTDKGRVKTVVINARR